MASPDELETSAMVDFSHQSPSCKRPKRDDEIHKPEAKFGINVSGEYSLKSGESSNGSISTSLQEVLKTSFSIYGKQNKTPSPIQADPVTYNYNIKLSAPMMNTVQHETNRNIERKDEPPTHVDGPLRLSRRENSNSWSNLKRDEGEGTPETADEIRESLLKNQEHVPEADRLETAVSYPALQESQLKQQQQFLPMPNVIWFNQHPYPPHPYTHPLVSFPYDTQQYWMYPVTHGGLTKPVHSTKPDMAAQETAASQNIPVFLPCTESAASVSWFATNPVSTGQGNNSLSEAPQSSGPSVYATNDYLAVSRNPGSSLYSQATQYTGLGPSQSVLAPYYARSVLPLSTSRDDEWLSAFLCFVRSDCIEVFTASHEDVASRMNSKKVLEEQVGIRCRFCAHIPHRERAGRSSSFPSSISRIYQSLTMMLRDHFPKCNYMPSTIKERYLSLRENASQGATDSKRYWTDSAHELGLVDTDAGIRFTTQPSTNDVYANPSVIYDPYAQNTHAMY